MSGKVIINQVTEECSLHGFIMENAHKFDMSMEGVREKMRTKVIIKQVVEACSLQGLNMEDRDMFIVYI